VIEHWSEYLRVLTAMFVIVNPLGAIPMYAGLTSEQPAALRRRTARVAALTAAAILGGAVLAGEWMLLFFGIDVYCFQVGGGILLLMIAVAMFHAKSSRAKTTPEETHEAENRDAVGVVPLGTPLLVGPGAISTAIIYAHKSESLLDTGVLLGACFCVAGCVWITLRMADRISAALGRTGMNILNRLMGLILAAVAVKFIAEGAAHLLPGLAAPPG
jgi:multiple antibiotic resistance protein